MPEAKYGGEDQGTQERQEERPDALVATLVVFGALGLGTGFMLLQ